MPLSCVDSARAMTKTGFYSIKYRWQPILTLSSIPVSWVMLRYRLVMKMSSVFLWNDQSNIMCRYALPPDLEFTVLDSFFLKRVCLHEILSRKLPLTFPSHHNYSRAKCETLHGVSRNNDLTGELQISNCVYIFSSWAWITCMYFFGLSLSESTSSPNAIIEVSLTFEESHTY